MSQYDLRAATTSATTPSIASLAHPATPSCIAVAPPSSSSVSSASSASEHQVITGAYDGVVRLWDLRSTKGAVAAFHAWESKQGGKKILSVDWARGLVGVGGEGGVEVWKVGEGDRVSAPS